jgi:hypothetical protein
MKSNIKIIEDQIKVINLISKKRRIKSFVKIKLYKKAYVLLLTCFQGDTI